MGKILRRPRAGLIVLGCLVAVAVLYPAAAMAGELAPSGMSTVEARELDSLANAPQAAPAPARPKGVATSRPTVDAATYRAQKEAAAKAPAAVKPSTPTPQAVIGIAGNYAGTSQCGPAPEPCWYPPDTNGSVSKAAPYSNQAVSVNNSKITVHNKTTGAVLLEQRLATLMGYSTQALFDPRIEYDQTYERWYVAVEAFQESPTVQRFFVAISNNSDATGGWCVFSANITWFGNNDFFDYPQMGNQQDSLVFTANIFPAAGGYAGASVFAWPKAKLVNCKGFSYNFFTGFPGTTTPANVIDANPRMHLLTRNTATNINNVTYKNPGNINYSSISSAPITVPSYNSPPNAPQAGSAILIDTLDARFVNNHTQYGDHLWATHSIGLTGSPFAFAKYYDFDTEGGGANTIKQQGVWFATGTSFDYNPSIAAHTDGRVALNWTVSDGGVFPQMWVGGRVAADAAGAVTKLFGAASPGPITANGSPSRWGDTSSVRYDTETGSLATAYNELAAPGGTWTSRWIRFSVT